MYVNVAKAAQKDITIKAMMVWQVALAS